LIVFDKRLVLLPGLVLATGLAVVAWVAGSMAPVVGGPVFGIVLGMTVRALWKRLSRVSWKLRWRSPA